MANKLPPLPVGVAPGSGYWNDWYEKLRTLINSLAAGFPWSSITGTPTTIAGYGIVDALSTSRTINTTAPLTGGGDLSANRTLAITEFSGTVPGSVPTSLGGTTNFLRADGAWAAPGGGGGGTWTEVEIDFGTQPVWDKSFTITDGAVSGTSKIIVVPSGNPATGRASDDWQWDSVSFAADAGTGSFTLYANANGPVEGKRNIFYQVV